MSASSNGIESQKDKTSGTLSESLFKTIGLIAQEVSVPLRSSITSNFESEGWDKSSNIAWSIHPDKQLEAYCKKDDSLLWVVWILDKGHKHHEVITLSRAYKEQKLYVKHKLSKIFKNKEIIKEKQSSVWSLLETIDYFQERAVAESEEFYNNIIETVQNIKRDSCLTIQRMFSNYKRELAGEQNKISQILDTLKSLSSKKTQADKNKAAIKFLQCKKEIDLVVKDYALMIDQDISLKIAKIGFNYNKEKWNLLQILRSVAKNPKLDTSAGNLKPTKNVKPLKHEDESDPYNNIPSTSSWVYLMKTKKAKNKVLLNTSSECKVNSLVDTSSKTNRSISISNKSKAKTIPVFSRLTAPTRSSELKHQSKFISESDCKTTEKAEQKAEDSDHDGFESESDQVETPVISFKGSDKYEDDRTVDNDTTPIISASHEIYSLTPEDASQHMIQLTSKREVHFDDFMNSDHTPDMNEQFKALPNPKKSNIKTSRATDDCFTKSYNYTKEHEQKLPHDLSNPFQHARKCSKSPSKHLPPSNSKKSKISATRPSGSIPSSKYRPH